MCQSEASSAGQVHRTVQSVASTKKRQGSLLVQSDSSGRTTRQTPRHTDKLLRLSQSKGFGASFRRTTRQNLRLSQSHPSDGSSFGRICVSTNHILWTDHPSDEIFVSTNHILRTHCHTDKIFVSTNHILRKNHHSEGLLISANQITLKVI